MLIVTAYAWFSLAIQHDSFITSVRVVGELNTVF
jgi:hypothetical protein